ncbi:MAG: RNA polymerase-associated protein RapA [Puniceicoccaceae bacterium]
MQLNTVGQRCMSEPEPELGLGIVVRVETYRIWVDYPAVGEQRLYARDTPALRRIRFHEGERVAEADGKQVVIASIEETDGLCTYVSAEGERIREDAITGLSDFSAPQERFMKAQVDANALFNLRYRALRSHAAYRSSHLRGLMGGRVELIPHQLSILNEVASRQNPRVLLADEVGMGKTIEACLILQRLLTTGKVSRVLVLVPDALVNQWFVELLRRFNFWFAIYDEERCRALEKGDVDGNPFRDESLVLCSLDLLADSEVRAEQAAEAGWDMVVIDEAHHLEWSEQQASREYQVAEALARATQGLLLLTATPTQLGMTGHFARLRLLDPDRFDDYARFVSEADHYANIAEIAARVLDGKPLRKKDQNLLESLFSRNPDRLETLMEGMQKGQKGAETALLRTLLDEYGTGRVVFRNTRDHIQGFPERCYHAIPLPAPEGSLLHAHLRKEVQSMAGKEETDIRYDFSKDPRIEWLVGFLKSDTERKVLLICRSLRKAKAIQKALHETAVSFAMFHEELSLVQRDRNAATFAEPDGVQLLVCSEIGSEGRNFQFAHDLVLFDLPLDPGLLEQRIGRLDRIGQRTSIQIHVPYVIGSAMEIMARWYHEGLNAFECSLKGSEAYVERFEQSLLGFALAVPDKRKKAVKPSFEELLDEARSFRAELDKQLHDGRDRLLELNSYNPDAAARLIQEIREREQDSEARTLLFDLMEHYGIQVTELEGDAFHLDPSHAYLEAFPSLPPEGTLASLDRNRAVSREDMTFITEDHPIFRDAIEALLSSPAGSSAFSVMPSEDTNLLLECIFVIEPITESRWQVEQFLSPTPVRIVVDVRGRNRTEDIPAEQIATESLDGNIHRFLEQPMFNFDILKNLISGANRYAQRRSDRIANQAAENASTTLGYELRRLADLKKLNDHVRDEEIQLLQERMERVDTAIREARLRLDSMRVVMMGPQATLQNVLQ